MSSKMKQTSVFLNERQIDFLSNLSKMIEKQTRKKMSRSKLMKVLMQTLTCIKPEIHKCRSEKEIERELLKCFKKAVKEQKNDKGANY